MDHESINPYRSPVGELRGRSSRSVLRPIGAVTILVVAFFWILSLTRGPLIRDGLLFWLPIVLGATISFCIGQRFARVSVSRSGLIGSIGGIAGHLVWFCVVAALGMIFWSMDLIWIMSITIGVAATAGAVIGSLLGFGFGKR